MFGQEFTEFEIRSNKLTKPDIYLFYIKYLFTLISLVLYQFTEKINGNNKPEVLSFC